VCGIAGWLGALQNGEEPVPTVLRALHHKGPDAHHTRKWADATSIHTRLGIIDLSPTGAQPMSNEDGTVWTVFNGEIYNHLKLRHQLEARGHVFRGRSDTEVLPHLYEQEGSELVRQLSGMFAFAVDGPRARTLLLARDRFGIKPLFYAVLPDRFMFASEIRALLGFPGADSRPNRQAIQDFAALFYIPALDTCFLGVGSPSTR
jgi:asparagine synthase (glutamine-hydrolysing)